VGVVKTEQNSTGEMGGGGEGSVMAAVAACRLVHLALEPSPPPLLDPCVPCRAVCPPRVSGTSCSLCTCSADQMPCTHTPCLTPQPPLSQPRSHSPWCMARPTRVVVGRPLHVLQNHRLRRQLQVHHLEELCAGGGLSLSRPCHRHRLRSLPASLPPSSFVPLMSAPLFFYPSIAARCLRLVSSFPRVPSENSITPPNAHIPCPPPFPAPHAHTHRVPPRCAHSTAPPPIPRETSCPSCKPSADSPPTRRACGA
jgi:hypothetical protein